MHRRACLSLILIPALLLAACDLPRDPEGTSQRISDGEVVIGRIAGAPEDGAERRALARIVSAYSATPRYVDGDAHHLFAALREGRIDLIAGTIPQDTPFAKDVGLTDPVSTTDIGGEVKKTVFALQRGENRFLATINRQIAAGQ